MPDNTFSVARNDISSVTAYDDGSATSALAAGAVRLRVGPFAFTSNNVTYGMFGVALNYFDFFPAPEPDRGRIPTWGFADVVESKADGVAVGERFFGFLPMSSHVVMTPVRVAQSGFVDGAPHRAERAAVYNRYMRCSDDPLYRSEHEGEIAVLRPLFSTAFLLDDFLADAGWFGARAVILSSASSKTAYATAALLAKRRGSDSAVAVVGLTSKGNRAFVESLGCYDEVATYDEVTRLSRRPAAYVDIAGDSRVTAAVHGHFREDLRHSAVVGGTHWNAAHEAVTLPGPMPAFFFAPTQVEKRTADWGSDALGERLGAAFWWFLDAIAAASPPWLEIARSDGLDATLSVYRQLLAGGLDPRRGHVLAI